MMNMEEDYCHLLRMLAVGDERKEDEKAPAPGLPPPGSRPPLILLVRSCLASLGWSGKGRVRRV